MTAVEPLDAADPAAMAAWHATYLAADVHEREHATPWMLEEQQASFLGDRPGERVLGFTGRQDGEVVSVATVRLTLKEHLDTAEVGVWTHPRHRNRGHGSAMLEHVVGVCRTNGRHRLVALVPVPYDGPADGVGHPYADFAVHRGFRFDLGDVVRELELPADVQRVRRLAEEAAPYHEGYTLRQFRGAVPDDILLPFGALIGSLMAEAPSGEVTPEHEHFDEDRIRADELVFEASGRTKYTTVAIAPDGDVVAYSEAVVPQYDPEVVYQWGTLVAPGHRGHRLGLASKAANLLWLQAEEPGRSRLVTTNAEVNRHMIAVNEALGFRPVERVAEYVRTL